MATPKATSGVSIKEAARRKKQQASSPAAFKKKTSVPVELPCGEWAVLKRPGMDKFLSAGFMPDALSAVVRREIEHSNGSKPTTSESLTEGMDMDDVSDMMAAMDRVCAYVFVEPTCRWHMRPVMVDGLSTLDEKGREVLEEIPEDERDPDQLYTDELELEDKQFVFNVAVGGSPDLTRFRAATASAVDAVPASGAVVDTTE